MHSTDKALAGLRLALAQLAQKANRKDKAFLQAQLLADIAMGEQKQWQDKGEPPKLAHAFHVMNIGHEEVSYISFQLVDGSGAPDLVNVFRVGEFQESCKSAGLKVSDAGVFQPEY